MASQDDRNKIGALSGIHSHTSIIPDHANRWPKAPPKTIELRNFPLKGNSAVTNPYTTISQPNLSHRANPTANVTLLSGITSGTNKVPRLSSSRRNASRPVNQGKGKGKSKEPRPSLPPEIIDVDAGPAPRDELNITDSPSSIMSPYFHTREHDIRQSKGLDGSASEVSLVKDGKNTDLLRKKIESSNHTHAHQGDRKPQKRDTSPIGSFSDGEAQVKEKMENSSNKSPSRVGKLVARYNGMDHMEQGSTVSNQPPIPIIDLKKSRAKERMQAKFPSRFKFLQTASQDVLSNPSGLGNAQMKTQIHLPIFSIKMGDQEMHDYRSIVIDDRGRTMVFQGTSRDRLGPIELNSTNFMFFKYTKPLNESIHSPIFYFKCRSKGNFTSLRSSAGSMFKPGNNFNQEQISVKFDTSNKQWNSTVYHSIAEKISDVVQSDCMSATCSRTIWNLVGQSMKYRCSNADAEPPIFSPPLDSRASKDALSVGSSSRKRPVDQLSKYSHPSASDSVISTPKLPSDANKEKDANEAVTALEPPTKRQRVEESQTFRRSARQQEKFSSHDADEVILVYPYGVPGAVNVTAGDLSRLQPDEFLNDTLIEFGFKVFLKELEATYPELVSQVYVFSSFFYKKLNRRNIKEGYNSVRKWTSKIDIFSKKYIFIPINEHLHWYLAIIYEPEHVLQAQPSSWNSDSNAVTRKRARESPTTQEKDNAEVKLQLEIREGNEPSEPRSVASDKMDSSATSENEVETSAFLTSPPVTTTYEHLSIMSFGSSNREKSPDTAPGSPMRIDTDIPSGISEQPADFGTSDIIMGDGTPPIKNPDDSQLTVRDLQMEIMPSKFYRESSTNRHMLHTQKSQNQMQDLPGGIIVDSYNRHADSYDRQSRTKIFILDSLGNRHPQAMKQLNKWLELEAMDKKNLESVIPAITKLAPVPVQPNFCDCGLYILHFAKTFMSNPRHFCQIIMANDRPTLAEMQNNWRADSILTMRKELIAQILSLSEDWRQQKAAQGEKRQQAPQEQEGEDSDVAIVEHVKAPGKKSKSIKPARTKT